MAIVGYLELCSGGVLEGEETCRRIRGLDHLHLDMAPEAEGLGARFCVSQLYLDDTEIMLQKLEAAKKALHYYMFGNMDLVKRASCLRSTLVASAQLLQAIVDGLKDDLMNRDALRSLEKKKKLRWGKPTPRLSIKKRSV